MKTVIRFFVMLGFILIFPGHRTLSQVSISSDNSSAHPSAMLDVKSTSKGLLIPRMTQNQIGEISNPANGLQVFCTTDNKIYIYITTAMQWKEIAYGTGIITPWTCGVTLPINHFASGGVAPVDKTVTYGTVTNIPGEPTKCWITSNLGADHQATSLSDDTEASAGWYWQFNRKQGYKHDGTTLTPGTAWIASIDENLNWQAANDPCALELGIGWRIPTAIEWAHVNTSGGWTNFNGPWNSNLKLHCAGLLIDLNGSLTYRSSTGYYWSSNQYTSIIGRLLCFDSGGSYMRFGDQKSTGSSLRCIRELELSTVTTVSTTNILQTSATAGGNITDDGGAPVTARGACWSTSTNPTITDSYTTDGSGTGVFVSNLTGLTANTLYYVRAYATNNVGTVYGNEVTFTTLPNPVPPTVTTTDASSIGAMMATSGGNIESDGGAPVIARGVCWNTSSNPTITNSHTTDGVGTGVFISNLDGLTLNTLYYIRAYAINSVGTAYGNEVSFTTLANCGFSIAINHLVTGGVAPVDKTITYGTVTNIPGEPTKCWITSNLGADHQATSLSDDTEASAGWYWQFNRKQGYKHDGTTLTPGTAWIASIDENLNWQAANDPCALELGTGWRIPTATEWANVNASGGWTNFNGPWNSNLKLHCAGLIYVDGSLTYRGTTGFYWSSNQYTSIIGRLLCFDSGGSYMRFGDQKSTGSSLRCIKD